jgi:hypothetical protein
MSQPEPDPDEPARLTVTNLLTVYQIRRNLTVPELDLFGVDLRIVVPADTEFPRTLTRLDVFSRTIIHAAGPAKLRIRVKWIDGPHPRRGHGVYAFQKDFSEGVQDVTFPLLNLRLPGAGWYKLILSQWKAMGWRGRAGCDSQELHSLWRSDDECRPNTSRD